MFVKKILMSPEEIFVRLVSEWLIFSFNHTHFVSNSGSNLDSTVF